MKKFIGWLRGFSLVEIMVSLIVISVITAALMPILTKRMKSRSNAIKIEGAVKYKCDKFTPNCRLCYKNGCLYCELTCSADQTKITNVCECRKCNEIHGAACIECNEFKCKKCAPGYYVSDGKCELCPAGSYCPDGLDKKPCSAGHYQDLQGQSACKNCDGGKWTDSTGQASCTGLCPAGDYCPGNGTKGTCANPTWAPAGSTACSPCTNCSNCNRTSGVCSSCNAGSILQSGKCNACGNPTWSAGGTQASCSACTNCSSCRNTDGYCTSCNAGSILQSGKCNICSNPTWSPGGTQASCLPCTNCSACNNTNGVCTSCNAGNKKSGNSCVACDSLTWSSGGTATSCTACGAGCSACSSTTGACTSCKAGYKLSGTSCVACGSLTWSSGGTATSCSACGAGCSACDSTTGACTSCKAGYYKSGTSCVGCTGATWSSGGTQASCSACTNCSACNTTNGQCSSCNDGYYLSSNKCEACSTKFTGCTKCTSTECTQCDNANNYFLSTAKKCNQPPANFVGCNDSIKFFMMNVNIGDIGDAESTAPGSRKWTKSVIEQKEENEDICWRKAGSEKFSDDICKDGTCWYGKGDTYTAMKDTCTTGGGYNACRRTVCTPQAAKELCAAYNSALPGYTVTLPTSAQGNQIRTANNCWYTKYRLCSEQGNPMRCDARGNKSCATEKRPDNRCSPNFFYAIVSDGSAKAGSSGHDFGYESDKRAAASVRCIINNNY